VCHAALDVEHNPVRHSTRDCDMTANHSEIERLYAIGRFAELVAKHSDTVTEVQRGRYPELRLMVAEALLFTGELERARSVARAEHVSTTSRAAKARCEVILGLADKKSGEFDSALRYLHAAVRLADSTRDYRLLGWCELNRFRLLIEGYKDAELVTHLAGLRRTVTEAGNPHLTALLHDSVAIMEGQAGRRCEARRHLDIAKSILSRHPHAWIELSVHTGCFCVAWLESDFGEARTHLVNAREAAVLVGGVRSTTILDVNQAHLDLVTGNFPAARSAFDRLLADSRSPSQLAAFDGLARLYLALNQRATCEELIRRSAEVQATPFDFYPLRWLRACSISLAIKCGKFVEALAVADRELARATELCDKPLAAHLLLLQAEALAAAGDAGSSGEKLARATELGVTGSGDQQGWYYATAARVLHACVPIASALSSRARRLWQRERNVWAQCATTDVGELALPVRMFTQLDVDKLGLRSSAVRPQGTRDSAFLVLNSVVSAFELAHDPHLAAAEIRLIAETVECSELMRIEIAPASRSTITESIAAAVLSSERRGTLAVSYRVSSEPAKTIAASNLLSLLRRIDDAARLRRDERTRAALWPAEDLPEGDTLFISKEMTSLLATARKVAPTTVPVLITGETGTGKEILARAVHAASTRASATFLPFNCSAGPRDMIDAQLFGHRRGAFTGATEHAPGVVRAAAGGTLFLDEIGESPLEVQPKLLRFLESGEIHPVGEAHPLRVDVRVMAATNVDLDVAVSTGRFREDLFYRLNIVRLHLPPLRERRVEIPVFAQHYLRKHARDLGKGDLRLAEETMEYLLLYKWPGNVRQLANEMRRMAALAETDAVLMPEHLSSEIVASRRTVPASERTLESHELVVRLDQPLAAATEHLERAIIPYALGQSAGRVEEAARKLGLSRKGLYLKRVRLGLETPEPQARSA
jgi:DNA-binding NtrC family response regulator/tetratricopeptide (TPR) repeat protein